MTKTVIKTEQELLDVIVRANDNYSPISGEWYIPEENAACALTSIFLETGIVSKKKASALGPSRADELLCELFGKDKDEYYGFDIDAITDMNDECTRDAGYKEIVKQFRKAHADEQTIRLPWETQEK